MRYQAQEQGGSSHAVFRNFRPLQWEEQFVCQIKGIFFGEHSVGRKEGDVFNEHLLCVRHLRHVRLLAPEIKCLFYNQEKELLRSEIT